ncbi:MAG: pectin acetylesterase-family hydrolase [Polyangiaceae bacterium]
MAKLTPWMCRVCPCLLLLACDSADGTGGTGSTSSSSSAQSSSGTGAAGGGGGGSSLPTVGEALSCGVADPVGGMAKGKDLERHDLDLTVFPDALCNDGTGAVIYFRPFTGAANKNRWVVQLLGGGSCNTGQDCADRWCGVGTNFSMTQMTSNVAPEGGTIENGIFARRPDNPIGDFNQVLVRYCSSDAHAGRSRDVVVDALVPGTTTPTQFRMHFLGASILDATLATLRGDGVPLLDFTIDGGSTPMPDLDDAELFVLAGASAGGSGTITNVDRVAAQLRTNHPGLNVVALIDSILTPDRSTLGYDKSSPCLQHGICDYQSLMAAMSASRIYQLEPEESCAAWHAAHDPANAFRCEDEGHLIRHHVTTPMFVRQGQKDSLLSSGVLDAGFGVAPGAASMTLDDYAGLIRTQAGLLPNLPTSAEEGAGVMVPPGVFSPTCPKHETLRSTPDVFDVTIEVGGIDRHFFDVVGNWAMKTTPSVAITPLGGVETCAP